MRLPLACTWIVIVLPLVAVAVSGQAEAQSTCDTRDCPTATSAWVAAAQIHQIKNEFVDALRQFTAAIAGTYGDEGIRITASLDGMQNRLADWDGAIREYEAGVANSGAAGAELSMASGTVYLDRGRVDDALREFAAVLKFTPGRVDAHTSAALAADLVNRPADAVRSLQQAAALAPDDPIIAYGLAQHLLKSGRSEDGQQAMQRFVRVQEAALETHRAIAPAPFERVNLLRQTAGVAPIFPIALYHRGFQWLAAGRYDEALTEFRAAAANDPLTMAARGDEVGAAALRQGRLAAALARLTESAAPATAGAEAHRLLGVAYWADDQIERSLEQLDAAIRLDSADERSRILRADILVAAQRLPEAEQALAATIQALPQSGQAHDRLGQVYQAQSLPDRAVREFEAAAAAGPIVGQDRLYEVIGGLHANQANFDATVDAYLRRIDVNPNNAEAHRKLGEVYFLQGRHDEALGEFTAALLLDPRNAEAHAGSGQVSLRLGQYARAASASRQALGEDPDHVKARYTLATALLRLGQTEEGNRELQIVQQRAAATAAAVERQAAADAVRLDASRSLARGDVDSAIALLRTSVAAEPNRADGYVDLGLALLNAGHPADALEPLRRALQLDDRPDIHRHLATVFKALGRLDESQREDAIYQRMLEAMKEDRLKKMAGAR